MTLKGTIIAQSWTIFAIDNATLCDKAMEIDYLGPDSRTVALSTSTAMRADTTGDEYK